MAEYTVFERMSKEEFTEIDSFLYHLKLRMFGNEEPKEEYNKFLYSLASFSYDYKKLSDKQIESLYKSAIKSDKEEFRSLIPVLRRVMDRVNYKYNQPIITGYHKESKRYNKKYIVIMIEDQGDLRKEVWCDRSPCVGEKVTFYDHPSDKQTSQEAYVKRVVGEKVYVSLNLEVVLR